MLRHCNLPLNIFTDFRGHNMAKYTKQQAISIITDCAVKYKENLDGYQLLFILKDKHKHISSLEVSFNPYNFLHLTGIKLADKTTATDFYERCLNHKLSPDDFSFAPDWNYTIKTRNSANNLWSKIFLQKWLEISMAATRNYTLKN